MRPHLICAALLLAACDSPSPAMMGQEASRHVIDNTEFSVRIRGTRAEAIRTNMMVHPSIGTVYPRAIRAIEAASGCRVIEDSLRGDTNVMRADLSCG